MLHYRVLSCGNSYAERNRTVTKIFIIGSRGLRKVCLTVIRIAILANSVSNDNVLLVNG